METNIVNQGNGLKGSFILRGLPVLILTLIANCGFAQFAISDILGDFADDAKRQEAVDSIRKEQEASLAKVNSYSRQNNMPLRGQTEGGQVFELTGIDPDGRPIYLVTMNANAGISTNANLVQGAPYNATGEGFLAGVWDAGSARKTHQEFMNTGTTRITIGDGAAMDPHSTAVAGTMAAAGIDAGARGMAPLARIKSYSWMWDTWELSANIAAKPSQAQTHMMISNHSYGMVHGWEQGNFGAGTGDYFFGQGYQPDGTSNREDAYFGRYGSEASYLDYLACKAPYWLYFKSAGNDRDDKYGGPADGTGTFYYLTNSGFGTGTYDAATAPFSDGYDDGGFDTMIEAASGKNIIAVGAVSDAVLAGERDPSQAAMTTYSGWGPADDGRIKPDLVANGSGLRSPVSSSDTAYSANANGTSFSAPNASGSAILLNDLAMRRLNGAVLRASTVKGLLLHSATDIGRPGPDYTFGWGLMDVQKAADLILAPADSPAAFHIIESLLDEESPAQSFNVEWDGTSDLEVSISWTDPRHSSFPLEVDNREPALVNDLDLSVEGPSGIYMPFVLDPEHPAENATIGNNVVDNFEKVIVAAGAPAGTYTIRVSHKSTLTDGKQWYSMVSGGQSNVPLSPPSLRTASPAVLDHPMNSVIEVRGDVFELGTQLEIRKAGVLVQEAVGEFVAMGRVFGEINPADWEYGSYDVAVITPNGSQSVLIGAFTYASTPPDIYSTEEEIVMHEGETVTIGFEAYAYSDGVMMSGLELPGWAQFTAGDMDNPATGTLTLSPSHNDGPTTCTLHVVATDDAVPPAAATLEITVRVFNTPTVMDVHGRGAGEVIITYDSAMAEQGDGAVLDPNAYAIESASGETLDVYSVVEDSANSYRLNTAEQVSSEQYTVSVSGVSDVDGNPISTDPSLSSHSFTGVNYSAVTDWRQFEY